MVENAQEIIEETLPPISEQETPRSPEEDQDEGDRSMNIIIPSMVGQFAFGSPPTSALPPGVAASPQSEQAQQYVNHTAPILDMIDFHRCLGPMAHISPMARLIIGGMILIGGVVIMKLPVIKQKKKEKEEKNNEKDQSDASGTG